MPPPGPFHDASVGECGVEERRTQGGSTAVSTGSPRASSRDRAGLRILLPSLAGWLLAGDDTACLFPVLRSVLRTLTRLGNHRGRHAFVKPAPPSEGLPLPGRPPWSMDLRPGGCGHPAT
jgi:hypothetical protein